MPIYEYACEHCGHEFETLVRSDSVPECPRCRATKLAKKLSVFATGGSAPEGATGEPGACGSCPHAGGPGACALGRT